MSVALKGIDGAFEVLGGLGLLILSPDSIRSLAHTLTQHELSQDPHDFIARHVLQTAGGVTRSTAVYAGLYLLSHGVAKVVLVVAVLRNELWAYPSMIVLVGAFIVYQLYRLAVGFTVGVALLTVFDVVVVGLTWREYQSKRTKVGCERRRARP